jgi:4-deoxy-L-threo-5-hexosulose-uronate ketol-isomerase
MGIINVAGDGEVTADGKVYPFKKLDCLYIGKGVKEVSFSSKDALQPAVFYIVGTGACQLSNGFNDHEAGCKSKCR